MKYTYSEHNIFHKIHNSDDYYIINPLRGEADILDPETAADYESGNFSNPEEWLEKGYILPEGDKQTEKNLFRDYYLKYLEERDESEIQIFWVPAYSCNFGCTYCYQEQYAPSPSADTMEVQKAFFNYVKTEFAGRKKYITVFGGEPLLPSDGHKKLIEDLIERANEADLSLAFVTNGYALDEYIPLLKKGTIREVQVTLDGIGETHDIRRPLKNGGGTYEQVVNGIDKAIKAGIPINLRAVLDRDNIDDLPKLAKLAREKGWIDSGLLKTQLGRNYELHSCQKDRTRLYDRVSMYEDIYNLVKQDPSILEFHRPAFSLSRFLWEQGKLPDPLFDSCPGCKTEWAFDYTGNIYSCTATVGKSGEELGTFYPEVTRKDDIIDEWEERDVTTIPECAGCSLRLACGGGCASVAKNNTGRIKSPDCRPVDKLMAMGLPLYLMEE